MEGSLEEHETKHDKEKPEEVVSEKLMPKEETTEQVVVTQPKVKTAKTKKRKKRFHFTQVQAEIVAWASICLCCWPLGAYALMFACQAKIAEDDEEFERRLVWSTRFGLAGLIFDIIFWPALVLIIIYGT